jgi:hypothetical protein
MSQELDGATSEQRKEGARKEAFVLESLIKELLLQFCQRMEDKGYRHHEADAAVMAAAATTLCQICIAVGMNWSSFIKSIAVTWKCETEYLKELDADMEAYFKKLEEEQIIVEEKPKETAETKADDKLN